MKPHSTETYWNNRFQESDTPWDLGEASPTLLALEKDLKRDPASSETLVPGCGTGSDALAFARLGYRVHALDWSEEAVRRLGERAERERLQNRLSVHQGDFWSPPAEWNQKFDLWVEHTFFCAIDPLQREAYLEKASWLLKPGADLVGTLFVSREKVTDPSLRGNGPPFITSEGEVRALFGRGFEILRLEPSPWQHPERRSGLEWAAHFRKK